jgi:hypothetical protein
VVPVDARFIAVPVARINRTRRSHTSHPCLKMSLLLADVISHLSLENDETDGKKSVDELAYTITRARDKTMKRFKGVIRRLEDSRVVNPLTASSPPLYIGEKTEELRRKRIDKRIYRRSKD